MAFISRAVSEWLVCSRRLNSIRDTILITFTNSISEGIDCERESRKVVQRKPHEQLLQVKEPYLQLIRSEGDAL